MKTGLLLLAMSLPLIQGCASSPARVEAPSLQPALAPLAGFVGSRSCVNPPSGGA